MSQTSRGRSGSSGWAVAVPASLAAVALAAAVAWAGGQGGAQAFGVPVIWLCAALAFAVQWAAFVPSYLKQTEHYYDLVGSLTYVAVIGLALALAGAYDFRSLLLVALVWTWAGRLGSFLFRRVREQGGDNRFDRLKQRAPSFLMAWTLQGLWVFLTLSAALAAITAGMGELLGVLDALGLLVWCTGFALEVIADRQKRDFRQDSSNRGRFIRSGLWSWSRHPNYFGEIVLWVGIAIIASSTLAGWRWVTLISPVFVTVLLTKISGIPLLEKKADDRWGGRPEYEAYKAKTSVLVPWPPRS